MLQIDIPSFVTPALLQVLARLDPDSRFFEGKRGACLGFVQQLAAREAAAPASQLPEVLAILADSPGTPVTEMVQTITDWAADSGLLRL